jgi:hypothetical protein
MLQVVMRDNINQLTHHVTWGLACLPAVAGAMAGVVLPLILCPTELVKCRMQVCAAEPI